MGKTVLRSRRVQLVGAMMLASGMPLGFIVSTFSVFLRGAGVDVTTIGLLSAVSMPWSLKFFWAPLVDRYALPYPDRRRSWVIAAQLALAAALGAMAVYAAIALQRDPSGALRLSADAARTFAAIVLVFTFAAATQDIALDAYSVEALSPEEQGPASGLRIMWYRLGMLVAGAVAISLADWLPWPVIFALLAGVMLLSVGVTLAAVRPTRPAAAPRSFLDAVVKPLQTFFARRDALVVAAFILLYKFGDNAAGTMVNAFLKDMCFKNAEIGLAQKTIGTAATIAGAGAGAWLMTRLGLARALWAFGVAQAAAIGLYAQAAVARAAPLHNELCASLPAVSAAARAWTYVGIAAEYATQGMATAAFFAFLMRVCDKRYSATQYALLSSLFGLGRTLSGIPSGWLVKQLDYPVFFLACIALALPGLLVLHLLAPVGRKELRVEAPGAGEAPPA